MTTLLASLIVGIAKFPLLRWQAGASSSSQDSSRRVLPKASDIVSLSMWPTSDNFLQPVAWKCVKSLSLIKTNVLFLQWVLYLIGHRQEPITTSVQLPYWSYVTAFLQTGLFLGFFIREIRQFWSTWALIGKE